MKSKIMTRCTFGSQKQNLLVENMVCNYNNNDKDKDHDDDDDDDGDDDDDD